MVVLVPKDPETHQDMFRRDQSDLDGSFTLPDVVPGSYTVVAVEDAWGFDWSKPTLLARYARTWTNTDHRAIDRRSCAFAGAGGGTAAIREPTLRSSARGELLFRYQPER